MSIFKKKKTEKQRAIELIIKKQIEIKTNYDKIYNHNTPFIKKMTNKRIKLETNLLKDFFNIKNEDLK